jgi:hypothetical protein
MKRWRYRGCCLGHYECPPQPKSFYWYHCIDNEDIYIRSDAIMECNKGHSAIIFDWSFKCNKHDSFNTFNVRQYFNAIQTIAGNSCINDDDFFQLTIKINELMKIRCNK